MVVSVLSLLLFAYMASKPSVGVKLPGEAFSKERLARDWKEIGAIQFCNMVRFGSGC